MYAFTDIILECEVPPAEKVWMACGASAASRSSRVPRRILLDAGTPCKPQLRDGGSTALGLHQPRAVRAGGGCEDKRGFANSLWNPGAKASWLLWPSPSRGLLSGLEWAAPSGHRDNGKRFAGGGSPDYSAPARPQCICRG